MPVSFGEVPEGTPFTQWRNATKRTLVLRPPGNPAVVVAPDGCVQITNTDLAKAPRVARWMAWMVLAGKLAIVSE
jgi:hypothetical protein